MFNNKSIICVIPARLNSTRFPRKMLAPLKGKPLVQWAYEGAVSMGCFDHVVVAVDCKELYDAVKQFGGVAVLTSPECQSGTERLAELQKKKIFDVDIWVNWQGDEPFINKKVIEALLKSCDSSEEEVWTLKKKIVNLNEISSPHVVKVICDYRGRALYFSRSTIPHYRDDDPHKVFYKHLGIYAFSAKALEKISYLPLAPLEKSEKLEQLRFLYYGLQIQVHETNQEIFGIDTKEQLEFAEQL